MLLAFCTLVNCPPTKTFAYLRQRVHSPVKDVGRVVNGVGRHDDGLGDVERRGRLTSRTGDDEPASSVAAPMTDDSMCLRWATPLML